MTISEWLAKGYRRCECENVGLNIVLHFKKVIFFINIYSGNWIKDFYKLLTGTVKKKKQTRWVARCNQCNALYLATYTKKRMIECLKISGMEYKDISKLMKDISNIFNISEKELNKSGIKDA